LDPIENSLNAKNASNQTATTSIGQPEREKFRAGKGSVGKQDMAYDERERKSFLRRKSRSRSREEDNHSTKKMELR